MNKVIEIINIAKGKNRQFVEEWTQGQDCYFRNSWSVFVNWSIDRRR